MEAFELTNMTVVNALLIVVAAIILDALLAIIKSFKPGNDSFSLKKLPEFVATGILPYAGGLGVLALAAQFIGEPYAALFYPIAAAVLLKYLVDIKDKLANLFGLSVNEQP